MEIFYLILWSCAVNVASSGKLTNFYDKILATVDDKSKYDNRLAPVIEDQPVEVGVELFVLSLRSVSATTMDYGLELRFRQFWRDPRLSFSTENTTFSRDSYLQMHETIAQGMWLPGTYLPNALSSTNPKADSISHRTLLRLKPDGSVLLSRRVSVTAECGMDFSLFPFDQQVCLLSMESYGHTNDDLVYSWHGKDAVTFNPNLKLPEFSLVKIKLVERNVTATTGEYSRLECCFFLKRQPGFYCVQYFLPAMVIVLAAWLLIVLSEDSTLGEMVGIILSLTFLFFSYISTLPTVAYVKAMDVFFGACFLAVSFALVKLSHTKWKMAQAEKQGQIDGFPSLDGLQSKDTMDNMQQCVVKVSILRRLVCGKLDGIKKPTVPWTLALFPVIFILFMVLYFIFYLIVIEDKNLQKCVFD